MRCPSMGSDVAVWWLVSMTKSCPIVAILTSTFFIDIAVLWLVSAARAEARAIHHVRIVWNSIISIPFESERSGVVTPNMELD